MDLYSIMASTSAENYDKYTHKETDQNGECIDLQIITHDDKCCQEFTVKTQGFNVRRWLLWTTVLNVVGFGLKLHIQDSRVMSVLAVILLLLLLVKLHFKVTKESLLVIAPIGIQITTTFATGRIVARFYDMANVRDIVINEAISMHRVVAYLTVIVSGATDGRPTKLVPLFRNSWPSLRCLIKIRGSISELLKPSGKSEKQR